MPDVAGEFAEGGGLGGGLAVRRQAIRRGKVEGKGFGEVAEGAFAALEMEGEKGVGGRGGEGEGEGGGVGGVGVEVVGGLVGGREGERQGGRGGGDGEVGGRGGDDGEGGGVDFFAGGGDDADGVAAEGDDFQGVRGGGREQEKKQMACGEVHGHTLTRTGEKDNCFFDGTGPGEAREEDCA